MSLFIDVSYLKNVVVQGKEFQYDTCFVSCELFGFVKLWLCFSFIISVGEMAEILIIDY